MINNPLPDLSSELLSILLDNPAKTSLAITDIHGYGLTYTELGIELRRARAFLKEAGISSADTVAISLRNGPETATLLLAVISYCRCAPLNPGYTAAEVSFVLRDVQARALITVAVTGEHANAARQAGVAVIRMDAENHLPATYTLSSNEALPVAAPPAARPPRAQDIALLLHTSGTTARPKLVPLTHKNLYLAAQSVANTLRLRPEDRCLSIMPLFHIHGLVAGLLASLVAGATVCCAPGFQAVGFFSWLDSSEATWYTAVPTMHQTILARARHNAAIVGRHKLRLVRSSSSPLYAAVWDQLEEVFGVPVLNSYGMTEAAHQIASVPLPGGTKFRNTVGKPAGIKMAIMNSNGQLLRPGETGEVVLRGDQITRGYLQPIEANETGFRNGWFRTGDEGVMSEDGLLTLTGRLKEMINSGGEKISPYEVEEALLQHPAIAQAVAFPEPHEMLGEQVAAAIVVREGFTVSERELLQVAGRALARAKLPRRIVFVAEIPPGPTGKLQRIGLAARLGIVKAAASGSSDV